MNGKVKRRHREVVPVCSVGGCWEDRAPGSEFCARGLSHALPPPAKVVTVHNLDTYDEQEFVGIPPREAVVAAYAQSLGDWNTWNYRGKYEHLLRVRVGEGRRTYACGAFTAVEKIEERENVDQGRLRPI